jgi:hypothetical protein
MFVKKTSIQDCHKLAESRGGKCLSSEYTNNSTKLKWECKEGHIWESAWQYIYNKGHWCIYCGGSNKKSIMDCHKLAESKGGKCLSLDYINSNSKLKWQCEKGHIWDTCYSLINQGSWCPECVGRKKKTIEDCHKSAQLKGGKCLSTEYIECHHKMIWECEKGHIWNTPYTSIVEGTWCPECVGLKKKSIQDCHKLAESKGGKCLSTQYINNSSKLSWECAKGHTWNATWNSTNCEGRWCKECVYAIEEMEGEIWKQIPNHNDYLVSNFGRVISMKTGIKKIYNTTLTGSYMRVYKVGSVHVLVAKLFIENPLNKPYVNHIDGNKLNNNVSNLEWCTAKENSDHALITGLRKQKKIYQIDLKTKTIVKEWQGSYQIHKELNVDFRIVGASLKLKHKSILLGFKWQYKDEYDQEQQDKKTNNDGSN